MPGDPASTRLDAARRAADLAALADRAEPVDLLVVGGGVTGAGVALDAASRGLDVVLVERRDLAFGTSRWSSKLVHGGLRYLATGNVGIARRSAIERGILMTRTAPHLVHAVPQLVPLLPASNAFARSLVRTGFLAGDALRALAGTPSSVLPRSRRIGAEAAAELSPTVRRDGLDGGLLAYDGQLVDDARLVVAIARTAAQHGARVLTRVGASQVSGDGALLTDETTGETLALRARAVVNATGVWAGEVDESIRLRPSRGTHLVFDAAAFGDPVAALTVPIPGETNRFVFAMPEQLGRVYLGLTDEEAPGPIPDEPVPTDGEIDFLLDTVNTALATPLTHADVRGAYAGLRPLLDTGGGRTADVSREHAVLESPSGVLSVVGGKLTEYRYMAEDAVDRAVAARALAAGPCRTRSLPLVGAPGNPARWEAPRTAHALPVSLVERYGDEAPTVVASATCARPLDPVADGIDVTRAEFEFAVTHEGALDASDVLDRRTRIGLVEADRARAESAAREFVS
ncbi:glycerol-3-phosphate dehydrogenase/oxidase [Rhodococcus sp. HNM0569]|uniref:FAD-dependent oxidoreductase n=1 Tax=Rhodococcus sp. HNM0569 TaxID=2716340 RepID=UPI00146CBC34|nr:glycerol-3-phosphate dehydrogenase/oxidase [Rhodococcus sp. HNM0569]